MANLNGLNPYVRVQAEKLIDAANKRIVDGKYKVIVTQGYRSTEEQDALYAQGRTVKVDKNGKKLPIVTNAKGGQSMHNFGLAIDFALATLDGKKASWDTKADFDKDGKADWMEVVDEAKKLGFEWGGDWRSFTDMPHFQMLGGLTEKDIRAGKYPKFSSVNIHSAKTAAITDTKPYHTVVKGDVVSKIAKKYGVAMDQIKKLNKLDDKYTISIGQKLRIK